MGSKRKRIESAARPKEGSAQLIRDAEVMMENWKERYDSRSSGKFLDVYGNLLRAHAYFAFGVSFHPQDNGLPSIALQDLMRQAEASFRFKYKKSSPTSK